MSTQDRTSISTDSLSIRPADRTAGLEEGETHYELSGTLSAALEAVPSNHVIPDELYDKYSPRKKAIIVAFLAYSAFLSPISSTTTLPAVPEIAADFNTTGSIINLSNGLYLLFMGFSPMFCGPFSEFYGRKTMSLAAGVVFFLSSLATALAPELISFFVFRIITAIAGMAFILVGTTVISDIYRPVERGTAAGWLLSGQLMGPAIGPFIAGLIVTYKPWQVIFWLQTALAGLSVLGSWFILPETIHHRKADDIVGYSGFAKVKYLASAINPGRIIALWIYPNVLLASLASAVLLWNMYSQLAPIRYVINPRYNLTTPLEGGLFYLVPGIGNFAGSFVGGRLSDYIVKRQIKKRNGVRIPDDRLICVLPFMPIIAICIVIYGWTLEKDLGGIPVTVIVMFISGFVQLCCFPALNTYCLDVMPGRSAEVISANYSMRYFFAFIATSVALPGINGIGLGWFSTLSGVLIVLGTIGVAATVAYGPRMRAFVERKSNKRKGEKT